MRVACVGASGAVAHAVDVGRRQPEEVAVGDGVDAPHTCVSHLWHNVHMLQNYRLVVMYKDNRRYTIEVSHCAYVIIKLVV